MTVVIVTIVFAVCRDPDCSRIKVRTYGHSQLNDSKPTQGGQSEGDRGARRSYRDFQFDWHDSNHCAEHNWICAGYCSTSKRCAVLYLSGSAEYPRQLCACRRMPSISIRAGAAGNSLKIRFEPNGSAIDDSGSLNNGAVYIAQTNNLNSQRAITLLGATARVRTWRTDLKNGVATEMELNDKEVAIGLYADRSGVRGFDRDSRVSVVAGAIWIGGEGRRPVSRLDTQARDQAQQVVESIFAARNAGSLSFSAIQNVSTIRTGCLSTAIRTCTSRG